MLKLTIILACLRQPIQLGLWYSQFQREAALIIGALMGLTFDLHRHRFAITLIKGKK